MAFDPSKVDLGSISQLTTEDIDETPGLLQTEPAVESLNFNMSEALKVNPDQHAKTVKLQRESNVPAFAIESDPAAVEQQVKLSEFDFSSMNEKTPVTANYINDDLNNAIIAQDDIDILGGIEETFQGLGRAISLGFQTQEAGFELQGVDVTPTSINDLIPASAMPPGMEFDAAMMSNELASNLGVETDEDLQNLKQEATDRLINEIQEFQAEREALTPDDLNLLQQGVRAGVESLANMAPGFALTVLSGGRSAPLLVTMGAQTFTGSYAEGRAEGLTPEEAQWFASIDAAIEVGTEVLPVGTLTRIITGKSEGFTKEALKFAVQEMSTEQLATLGQSINSFMFDLDDQLQDAWERGDVAAMTEIQLQRQAVTAIATVVAGGAQVAVAQGVNKTIAAVTNDEQVRQSQSEIEQQTIDSINDKSEQSKLRERDAESFRQFIEQADGDQDTKVYIDAVQTAMYLQTKSSDEINADPALQLLNDQVAEAAALGGDVVVPVADFATDFAGTEHFNQLRPAMTLSAETVAPFRQEQQQQETESYVRSLVAEAEENISEYTQAQDIFNTVRDQLVDTGQMSAAAASTAAQVVPAWATVHAKKTGKSIEQVYADSGLTIEGPQTGELARLSEEVLEQTLIFHGTSPEAAALIESEGFDVSRSADGSIWFTSNPDIGEVAASAQGAVVERAIDESELKLGGWEESDKFSTDELIQQGFDGLKLEDDGEITYQIFNPEKLEAPQQVEQFRQDAEPEIVAQAKNRRELENLGLTESERQINFEDWFDGSVVVDENGNPRVMYHGTGNTDSIFDGGFNPEITGQGMDQAGSGFYFTTDAAEARGYETALTQNIRGADSKLGGDTSPGTVEVYLSVKNPIVIPGTNLNDADVDLTADQVVNILQFSEIAKSEEDSPFGDFFEEYWDGGTQEWMYGAVADNYTGASLMSLEGDFFDGEATNFRKAINETLGFDGVIQEFEGDKRHVVAWFPEQIKSIYNIGTFDPRDPDIFRQRTNGDRPTARGYYDPANSIIRLTEAANLSTFLHEFAHFMYEMELQTGSETVQSINNWFKRNAEDVAKEAGEYAPNTTIIPRHVVAFLDTGTAGDAERDAGIRRAVHEQFARGFETYLMEGKSPSIELRNAFRTFARWLAQIYGALRGQLNVNLDAEMRDVFDRLLATEEQIAAAESRARVEPMFTDAAMAGMTETEFQDYQKRQSKVKDVQSETLREKMIKQLTRQTEKWWKEEKQDIVDEQLDTLKTEQVYRAREVLRSDELKLDHATVKDMVGELKTDKLGRKSTVIPTSLRGMTAKGQNGVHPDEAAAFFGYSSGSEMLDDLMTAPPIKDVAEANAEAEMVERHGDILTDGTIEREADEAVQNEERGKLILSELKVLSRGTTQPVIDRATYKDVAEERIGRLSFREINPARYRRAEINAAQEATRMLEAGNREGAARAKAQQVMNYYLGMEATRARNETVKIVDRMGRYRKKKVREEIQKAGNEYWEQIVKILERFEFRKSVTLKNVDQVNTDINTWMRERIEVDGDALTLSNAVLNEMYITHWKNVPFSDLQGINDSVKNMEHVARYSNKIDMLQEKVDFEKLVSTWTASMNEKATDRFISQRTDVVEGRNWGRWMMAQMTKIPYMASWLDGGERAGISHDILVQRFTEAYDNEIRMWGDTGKTVMDLITGRSKEDIKRHNTKIFIPEIKTAQHDGNLFGHQVIAVALNTGNAGNLRKMLLGEGWADPDNDATININNPQLQAVLRHMTESDWQMVQNIWDQMETLYPQLAEVHRRTTGLTPPKVEATPVETPYGEFRGGYYPVKYDPNRGLQAQQNEDKLNAQTESMFSNTASIQASVNAGATNERTGYYAPIRLSLDVVPAHFQETIHYITHHDPVRQVNKLIRNKEVAETIKRKIGPEEYAQLSPWLNDIAKDGREAPTKMFWDDMLQRLRFGVTLGAMGFKASTGIIQISGLSNTVAETGIGPVYQAARSILGNTTDMKRAWDFAVENSKVMSHRADTMDREIKNAMKRLEGKRGVLAAVQEASMKHIALIQTYMVDLPSWHAAYIKGMRDWGDEQRAYKYADWVVENVQGSGATKDLARIMRGQSETGRMFTMFMTFFSSLWNMERDLVKGARSGTYSTSNVAAKAMFLFSIPVLFEMMMRGELGEPEDEDDRLQRMLSNTAMYPIQSIPFIRDIANSIGGDFGYNISPIASLLEQGTQTIPEIVERGFTDEEITKGQAKGATKFIGAAVGIPGTGQAWATGEHLYDVMVEGEDFTTHQLLFGPDRD